MLQLSVNLLTQRTAIIGFHMQKNIKKEKHQCGRQEQILNNQQSSIHIKTDSSEHENENLKENEMSLNYTL